MERVKRREKENRRLGSTRGVSAVRREDRTGSAQANAGFVWRAVRRDGGEAMRFRAACA